MVAPTPVLGNTASTSNTVASHACNSVRSVGSTTALSGLQSPFVPIVRCNHTVLPAAFNTTNGQGCNSRYTSFHETFATCANYDLPANTGLTWLPNSGGYVVDYSGAFLPVGSVQATPTVLTIDDDQTLLHTFTTGSFPGWPGLYICANGMVADGNFAVAEYFDPLPTVNMNRAMTVFYCFADFDPFLATDPTYPGAGTVQVEESAAVTTVTWLGVGQWNHPTSLSTFQWQFYASGIVTLAIQNIGPTDTTNPGLVIGYSPGGPSYIPPARDLSAQNPVPFLLEAVDTFPLTLAAGNRPITNGNPWNLSATNIPAGGPYLGIEVYGFANPNIPDLFFQGMPGCGLFASLDVLNAFIAFTTTHNYSLVIPANGSLNGSTIFVEVAILDPNANVAGILASNGIGGTMGPF